MQVFQTQLPPREGPPPAVCLGFESSEDEKVLAQHALSHAMQMAASSGWPPKQLVHLFNIAHLLDRHAIENVASRSNLCLTVLENSMLARWVENLEKAWNQNNEKAWIKINRCLTGLNPSALQ